MDYLVRADVMLYGDLTVRNYLNDMYDIGHVTESETVLQVRRRGTCSPGPKACCV